MIVDDIRRALHLELRDMMHMHHPAPVSDLRHEVLPGDAVVVTTTRDMPRVFRDTGEPRRFLRIEVDRDREGDIMHHLTQIGAFRWGERREGPSKLEDVALYVVDYLSAPGWRVINPFKPGA